MSDDREDQGRDEELPQGEEELAEARELGERLDRALAGDRPATDETLAAALMLRAAHHEAELAPARRGAIVDAALSEAAPAQRSRGFSRLRRYAPALALAASLLLVAGSFLTLLGPARDAPSPRREVPAVQRSRSSDSLMGRPFEDRAGASRRLDLVFADRLSGYRAVRFGERSWR